MKVKTATGEINIDVSGTQGKPVVVMTHSLGCNLHMWDPQMDLLQNDFHVVRLDMRGHGLSDVTPGPYTLETLGDDAIAVMDELSLDRVHWVGLSIGGMIGQGVLLRYPERFLSATLCDTSSVVPSTGLDLWHERIAKVEGEGLASIADATMERWFTSAFLASTDIVDQKTVEHVRAQFTGTADAGYVACCHAIMKLNYTDRLANIKTPTCVIVGEQDQATPVEASQTIHNNIKGSELHILENASHIANVEQTDAFNAALMPFLRKHANPA